MKSRFAHVWMYVSVLGLVAGCGSSNSGKPMSLEKLDSTFKSFQGASNAFSSSRQGSRAREVAIPDPSNPFTSEPVTPPSGGETLQSAVANRCTMTMTGQTNMTLSGDECPISMSMEQNGNDSLSVVMDVRDDATTAELDARHFEMRMNVSRSGSEISAITTTGTIRSRTYGSISFESRIEPQNTARAMTMTLSTGGESAQIELFRTGSIHVNGRELTEAELNRTPTLRTGLPDSAASGSSVGL